MVRDSFDWEDMPQSTRKISDLIIYELHVRGFTQDSSSGVMHPGTFAGLREKIPYLKELEMCIRDSGYGVVYMLNEIAKAHNDSVEGKTIVVTGSGNVAIYAVEKATQLGAKVVAMNDSNGYVYDPNGINLDVVKDIKEVKRGRIKEYADRVEGATYTEGLGIWNIKCCLLYTSRCV